MGTPIGADRADLCSDGPRPGSRRSFLGLMTALMGPAVPAQDNADGRARSVARLEAMRRQARDVKVREIDSGKSGPPLALRPEPLLRYNEPGRGLVDGTLWGWGERGRPPAVMKLGFRGPARGQRHWAIRVMAFSPQQVEVEFGDGLRWSSRLPGLQLRSLADVPAPADSAAQRLAHAKAISRRFSIVAETEVSGRIHPRLLPRPIDRYSDPEAGLLDGALFGFVYATAPIVLLVLEAWSAGPRSRIWRYALVRQGAGETTALLDGKSVWSVPRLRPPVDYDSFITRMMPASPEVQD